MSTVSLNTVILIYKIYILILVGSTDIAVTNLKNEVFEVYKRKREGSLTVASESLRKLKFPFGGKHRVKMKVPRLDHEPRLPMYRKRWQVPDSLYIEQKLTKAAFSQRHARTSRNQRRQREFFPRMERMADIRAPVFIVCLENIISFSI